MYHIFFIHSSVDGLNIFTLIFMRVWLLYNVVLASADDLGQGMCFGNPSYKKCHGLPERVWRKGNPLALLVGMEINTVTVENIMEVP